MKKIVLKEEVLVNIETMNICGIERRIKTELQETCKRLLKQALTILEERRIVVFAEKVNGLTVAEYQGRSKVLRQVQTSEDEMRIAWKRAIFVR